MQTILYTDTDKIRAVLGVEADDISDATLTQRNLDKELSLDLVSWLPSHADISALGTQDQADSLDLYSTYFCASLVVMSLKMAAPQSISDGKNQFNRFSEASDWDKLQDNLKSRAAFYKTLLLNSLATLTTAVTVKTFSLVGSSYDPVTGA